MEKAIPTISGSLSASQDRDSGKGYSTNWSPTATVVRAAVIVSALITNSAPSQHAAEPGSRDRGEGQMNGPAAESQAHRMDAAADVVRQRSLIERIEQIAVGNANRDSRNQKPRQEAEIPAGVSD